MSDDIGLDDIMGAIIALQNSVDERFDRIDKRLQEAAEEREAIRNVVDNDLASYEQVLTLEGKMTDVQKTLRLHGKKIDSLGKERA